MAAYFCFDNKGYQQTTMRDICKAANLSTGAVYSYFSSKQAIVRGLATFGETKNQEIFEQTAKDANPLDKLKSIIASYFDIINKTEATKGLRVDMNLQTAGLYDDEIYAVAQKAINSRIKSIRLLLQQAKNQGLVRDDLSPTQSAQVILSILSGAILQKLYNPKMNVRGYKKEVGRWLDQLKVQG